jgi:hypothetical protein
MQHGTAIAAFCTPREIVIAADSAVIHGLDSVDLTPVEKIRFCDGKVYAINGISKSRPTSFNAFSLVENVLQQHLQLRASVEAITLSMYDPLLKAVTDIARREPINYQRYCLEQSPFGVTVACIEINVPVMANVRYTSRLGPNGLSLVCETRFCPGEDCPDGAAAVFVGPPDDVEAFTMQHPDYYSGDFLTTAREFVQTLVDKKYNDIGPPIRIIRLSADGVKWVQ